MAKKEHGNTIALLNNNNAEKYTLKEAERILLDMLEESKSLEYDYIGEIAKAKGTYLNQITYLIKKYPQLKYLYDNINDNIQTNCFYNAKKGNINVTMAIVSLKSNHKWNDKPQEEPIKIDTNTEIIIRKANNE